MTKGGENAFAETPQAARILEERFGEIFSDYERRLGAMGSLLIVGEGTTREQLESNARSILTRAARVLRREEASLLAVEEEIYRNIEAAEEPLNPHPDESFRAGVALCKAAVTVVVRNLPPETSREAVAEISLAVQEIVMDRVSRMVMASYVDYLLTKVKETQFEERRRFSRELHDRPRPRDDGRQPEPRPLRVHDGEQPREGPGEARAGPREVRAGGGPDAGILRRVAGGGDLGRAQDRAGEPHENQRARRRGVRGPFRG